MLRLGKQISIKSAGAAEVFEESPAASFDWKRFELRLVAKDGDVKIRNKIKWGTSAEVGV
ncbi:MAG: hypothetical protein ACTS4X_00650 [Candidatus Hodgkinia cicadicola]